MVAWRNGRRLSFAKSGCWGESFSQSVSRAGLDAAAFRPPAESGAFGAGVTQNT